MLDSCVSPVTTNQSLGVKDCVFRICGKLVLGSITNQTFIVSSKGHIGWGDAVTLVIGNDLNTSILENSNTK